MCDRTAFAEESGNSAALVVRTATIGMRFTRVIRSQMRLGSGGSSYWCDPLNLTVAKVAWDGHLVLFRGVARFAGARYAHQLWPAAYPSR
jgi:hypothetical protein